VTAYNGHFRGALMATTPISQSERAVSPGKELISFEEAMERLSREERFRATVYAMNTLLVQKGIYSPEEFEFQFRLFAQKSASRELSRELRSPCQEPN
jgi:hypothetical protein